MPAIVITGDTNPEIPSDVEDIIAKAFRLVEEREISSGDLEQNTNNDDEIKQIAERPNKSKKKRREGGKRWQNSAS